MFFLIFCSQTVLEIGSSVGSQVVLKNFVIQKENEKLTIFPLAAHNEETQIDTENNDKEAAKGNDYFMWRRSGFGGKPNGRRSGFGGRPIGNRSGFGGRPIGN